MYVYQPSHGRKRSILRKSLDDAIPLMTEKMVNDLKYSITEAVKKAVDMKNENLNDVVSACHVRN